MKIRFFKKIDKIDYIKTFKDVFPKIVFSKHNDFFEMCVKQKNIFFLKIRLNI